MRSNPYSPSEPLKGLVYFFEPENVANFGGREDEIQKIRRIISKQKYSRNVLIYGDFGTGKSWLVNKLVSTLSADDECHENFVFFYLDTNTLISSDKQNFPSIFLEIRNLLKKKKENVLIIDDINQLLQDEILRSQLLQLFKTPGTCVIATIDTRSYQSSEDEICDLVEKVHLEEPYVREVYDMIQNQIHDLAAFHGVKISKAIANWIIHASIVFSLNCSEPRRSLSVLDGVMACAKRNGHNYVRRSDFWSYFTLETKPFRKMSYEQRYIISIHEIGHLIVYLSSDDLVDYVPVATTCIPTIGYCGRTYFDASSEDIMLRDDESFYIQLIGGILAGKIAEEAFGLPANAGASEDLKKANKLAVDMASLYGMNSLTGDKVLLVDSIDELDETDEETLLQSELFNDAVIEEAQAYSEKILQEARKYASEIINSNKDLIAVLADTLAKEGILTKPDIDKLMELK